MPRVTTGRAYTLLVQCVSEAANACDAFRAQCVHDACEVEGPLSGIGLELRHGIGVAHLFAAKGAGSIRIALA